MRRFSSILLASLVALTITTELRAEAEEFKLRAGDLLQITVWKEDGLDRELTVLPDGTITFPLTGPIVLEGLTPAAAQDLIKEKLKKTIPDASVTVMVKAPLGHTVSVLGQVTKPGEMVMGHQWTVLHALSQAGGLTPYASEGGIFILRQVDGKKTTIEYPYDDITDGEHLEKDVPLLAGDVVFVPTAGLF